MTHFDDAPIEGPIDPPDPPDGYEDEPRHRSRCPIPDGEDGEACLCDDLADEYQEGRVEGYALGEIAARDRSALAERVRVDAIIEELLHDEPCDCAACVALALVLTRMWTLAWLDRLDGPTP